MNEKTISVLEFPKIREEVARFTSYSASNQLIRELRPTRDIHLATTWQKQTSEGRRLILNSDEYNCKGVEDIRPFAVLSSQGGILLGDELLSIKNTLIVIRNIHRAFDKQAADFPAIAEVIGTAEQPTGIIELISRCISERGEVMDSSSDKLANIRREVRLSHERLLSKLERLINDPKNGPMLQETIITQRDGRYVIPLRSEFKGQIKSIVHDQSSSGATLFVEPLIAVELNNTYKELQLEEQAEVRRVLAEISAHIAAQADAIIAQMDMLAQFDAVLARARYADHILANEPVLLPIQRKAREDHPGTTVKLYHARHPLLDPQKVVAVDIDLDADTYGLIITGPNTGGKTVTLKTVGLLALMAQSGLHIPAQSGSELSVFDYIFADIGDEQSIEQSLSTFSGHITNIIHILKKADAQSLVLLDELGAGTDPQEGAALAMAILKELLDRKVTTFVATHYPELKAFAHNTRGVINASLEFDVETLRPTYHLLLGIPGRSNALSIAEKLGLPNRIIEKARADIHPDELRTETLLDEIYQQRKSAREARESAEQIQRNLQGKEQALDQKLEKIEDERIKILDGARKEFEITTAQLRNELDSVKRALARARQPLDTIKELDAELSKTEEVALKPTRRSDTAPTQTQNLKLGSKVHVISLDMDGIVTGLTENEVEVQIGSLRLRARMGDLRLPGIAVEEKTQKEKSSKKESLSRTVIPEKPASPGMELDLRGQRAEDALDMLDRYIEQAYQSGMPFVRIIHGKGTGRLRQVIREALRESHHVRKFDSGMENEGGDGVTVATLAED